MDDIEVEITQCGNSIVTLESNDATVSGGYLPVGDYVLRTELYNVSGALQEQLNGSQSIVSGLSLNIDRAYQNFSSNFSSIPKVLCQVEISGSNPYYSVNTTNITVSGFTALFSDFISESGCKLHTFAKL